MVSGRALHALVMILVAFAAGCLAPLALSSVLAEPVGENLRCVGDGRVCTGMSATPSLAFDVPSRIGRFESLFCGFGQAGGDVGADMTLVDLAERGCSAQRYVLVFTDDHDRSTNIWVDNGKIVRIDRELRHRLDF